MSEGGIGEDQPWFDPPGSDPKSIPPGFKWLFKVLLIFPLPNLLFVAMAAMGTDDWHRGEWAKCGGNFIVSFFSLGLVFIIPVFLAVFIRKMRMPMFIILAIWTAGSFTLPIWMNEGIEVFCGPRPW